MIKNITRCLLLSWLVAGNLHATTRSLTENLLEKQNVGFTNLEHQLLGDRVSARLKWAPLSNPSKPIKLHLPNGLALSYGDILMLGGDFFGDEAMPISNCAPHRQTECFKAHFATLAHAEKNTSCKNPFSLIENILSYLSTLDTERAGANNQGQTDWEFYKTKNIDISKKLNNLTCGGSRTIFKISPSKL